MKKIMFLLSMLMVLNASSVIFAAQKIKQISSRAAGAEATPSEHPVSVGDYAATVGSGITVDPANNVIIMGNNDNNTAGAIWYAADADTANCLAGECNFSNGIRAYFEFTFCNTPNCTTPYNADNDANSGTYADGFTFAIINGSNNDTTQRSGAPPPGTALGELGGYAGPDNTVDQLGIHHPKMAIEFDTYWNTGSVSDTPTCTNNRTPTCDGIPGGTPHCTRTNGVISCASGFVVCNSAGNPICAPGCAGGRNDGSGATYGGNHIALLLWGYDYPGDCSNGYLGTSFDDNYHGAGGTTGNPINSAWGNRSTCILDPTNLNPSTTSACGYYNVPKVANVANWLEDAAMHRFRLEIRRASAINANGNYNYDIAVWIDCPSCTSAQLNTFKDLNYAYTALNPKIYRRVEISPADHALFNTMYFGFTQSTGGSTQTIQISNLVIYFPCWITLNPASASYANTAFTGRTVNVTAAGATTTWTAVSQNTGWITVTSGANGTGNGPVQYNVSANGTGVQRTGSIQIGCQTFTITQSP